MKSHTLTHAHLNIQTHAHALWTNLFALSLLLKILFPPIDVNGLLPKVVALFATPLYFLQYLVPRRI
jgi:hypothetical protein